MIQSHSRVGLKLYSSSPNSLPRLSSQVRCPSRATSHSVVVGLPGPFILLNESFPTGLPAIRALQREPHPTGSNFQGQLDLQPPKSSEDWLPPNYEQQNKETQCLSLISLISLKPPTVPSHSKTVLPIQKSAAGKAV